MIRPAYLIRILDACSQLINVLLLFGDANESVSGRSHRQSWLLEHLIDILFFWEEFHCSNAYYSDLARAKDYINQHEDKKCLL
jgi:hypothetical protein